MGYRGIEMIDRCEIIGIREARGHSDARSVITLPYSIPDNLEINYVKESVQDICAAVDDCADATRVE